MNTNQSGPTRPRMDFWTAEDVAEHLRISRPTAYRLMHESGAMVKTPRRCRVFVPDFIAFLRKDGGNASKRL